MSTIALPAQPIAAAPPPSSRQASPMTGDQRIAIRGVSWDLYDRLSEAIGDKQHVFLAYDGKDLEIMTKGPNHEDYRDLIGDFVKAVRGACGIPGRGFGETTWKRAMAARGIEADQCYLFDPDKLAIANAAAKRSNSIADYPDPDLVVKIDISPPLVDRPGIYAALKGLRNLAVRRRHRHLRATRARRQVYRGQPEPLVARAPKTSALVNRRG